MPCQELFETQSEEYKEKILDKDAIIVSLEASSTGSWNKYTKGSGISIGIDFFGKSAPYKEILNHFGLTSSKIVALVQNALRK